MLKIKDVYVVLVRRMKVKNGKNTLFWLDAWLYDTPLSHLFPDLFKLCEQPMITVSIQDPHDFLLACLPAVGHGLAHELDKKGKGPEWTNSEYNRPT